MARTIGKLTALGVDKAKHRGYYGDGGGLFLQVSASGSKSWVFRFKEAGKLHEMGLGATHTIGLAEARDKARECRRLRLDGIDPIEARKVARAQTRLAAATATTFKDCAERYIASHKASWRSRAHAAQWPSTLGRYVYPVFGLLPVQAVDVGLVLKVLEPIWTTKPETANRVRGRIESVLDWATARGYREGENPARWRGHLENLLPGKSKVRRVKHHAALPFVEIGDFMAELHEQEGVATRALEFTILTASRPPGKMKSPWRTFTRSLRMAIAASDSGTRCSLSAFMRSAGTVQSLLVKSISSHVAQNVSPLRAAVRMVNSKARARCRLSSVARSLAMKAGISP